MTDEVPAGELSRRRLHAVRHAMIELHKALLDAERDRYERAHGRVSAGKLLQLSLHGEQFAWLHPVSALIVQIDEIFDADKPLADKVIDDVLESARVLLTPREADTGFGRAYEAALQREPGVVVSHGRVMEALRRTSD